MIQVQPLYLIAETDELLRTPMPEYDEWGDRAMGIAAELGKQMLKHNGVGLSANQLGMKARAFSIRTDPILVCFNPVIVNASDEQIPLEEGCLTYPGLKVMIKRPKEIRARFADVNGQIQTVTFGGLTARIFQHELDHINGVNFIDRAGPLAKQRTMEKWKRKLKPKADLMRKLTMPKPYSIEESTITTNQEEVTP